MKKPKRKCPICGAPEKVIVKGPPKYVNLAPYSGVCVDCINNGRYP